MSWFSSWLPGLPQVNLALPSSIQGRFISFLLKKSLGKFVKPGQLDIHQIDSQIGSGFVQVNDLQLEHTTINTLLSGLPVELYDGSIAAVIARIPWPNPLTSTVGFSIRSLHLTFHLVPTTSTTPNQLTSDLASSVASIAESFIHDELTPREKATTRESFYHDFASSAYAHADDGNNVPGSIDPFLSAEGEEFQGDADPAGVSIFASLIERLLARFEFDAVDTKITLIHPGNASFTVTISEILYGTDTSPDAGGHRSTDQVPSGETRRVSISGIKVTARNLRRCNLPPSFPATPSTFSTLSPTISSRIASRPDSSPHSSRSISPSSSLDEDTQIRMSQSLAFLPPRPPSPASSLGSSLYHSAVSEAPIAGECREKSENRSNSRTPSPCGRHPADTGVLDERSLPRNRQPEGEVDLDECEVLDEMLLSFGAEPVIIRLTTSPPSLAMHPSARATTSSSPSRDFKAHVKDNVGDQLQLYLDVGIIACALRAWHIQCLLDLLIAWASHRPSKINAPSGSNLPSVSSTSPATGSPMSIWKVGLEGSLRVRGVVMILLSTPKAESIHKSSNFSVDNLETGFFVHPLLPPKLTHGYIRAHLEVLSLILNLNTSMSAGKSTVLEGTKTQQLAGTSTTTIGLTLTMSELSILAIHAAQILTSEREIFASPILITDRHLPSQYPTTHFHQGLSTTKSDEIRSPPNWPPTFDVTDWMDEKYWKSGLKLSTWRTKPKPIARRHVPRDSRDVQLDPKLETVSTVELAKDVGGQDNPVVSHASTHPAIIASIQRVLNSPTKGDKAARILDDVEVKTAPLHVFLDLGMALSPNGISAFLDTIFSSRADNSISGECATYEECNHESDDRSEEEDGRTSLTMSGPLDAKARAKERRRLERLVLRDLDLDQDYRQKHDKKSRKLRRKHSKGKVPDKRVSFKLPMIRIQVRTISPSSSMRRSGAFILDLHDVVLSIGSSTGQKPKTRFANHEVHPLSSTILSAECGRVVISCSPAGVEKATAVLSLGPLSSVGDLSEHMHDNAGLSQPVSSPISSEILPRIVLTRSHCSASSTSGTLALIIHLPSVNVHLSKAVLDDLQYWTDDTTQLVERTFGSVADVAKADSRDASLIGSRFFARSRRSDSDGGSALDGGRSSKSETVIKVTIAEACIRLMVPRDAGGGRVVLLPFEIFGSDVDVLMELNPGGRQEESVLTVGVIDLNVVDISIGGKSTNLLSLTSPRSLSSSPKSLLKLRLISLVVPETTAKESRIKLTLWGFTHNITPDFHWATELAGFIKAPPDVFESVIPSERTRISLKIMDGSIRVLAPVHPGALLFHIEELDFSIDIVGNSAENSFNSYVTAASILFLDDLAVNETQTGATKTSTITEGKTHWKAAGYALLSEIADLDLKFKNSTETELPVTEVVIDRIALRLHLCADTMTAVSSFIGDLSTIFNQPIDKQPPKTRRQPAIVTELPSSQHEIMSSVDQHAFKKIPEVGPAPDMIVDDLPTNLDYLDEAFGAAAGMRELSDDDSYEFDSPDTDPGLVTPTLPGPQAGIISRVGGETIKILRPEGLQIIDNYFDTLPLDSNSGNKQLGETTRSIRVHNCDVVLFLYDGYDWAKTRKIIENEVKEMRRRLAKIRQLIATGQTQDPSIEETGTLLFNSVYIGLPQDIDELEPGALIAAIDEELNDEFETASQSSWQSLKPSLAERPRSRPVHIHNKRLTRSRGPSMEFRFSGLDAEIDRYWPDETLLSRTLVTVKDLEILDHIKTSTWQKFLTELRVDSRGNIRETDSHMVRVELRSVRPVPGHESEEARLRAKILPLRLYVDQDALDFLKRFFSFEDPHTEPRPSPDSSNGDIYFQFAEIFSVDLKLDYKPRRVDYRALREGRSIELMNFFHFDGAEMTLRHITLSGVSGWPRLFEMLNDLWTPDVKATQLMDVISGVSPIRSVVNVGSGIADLVLLPIAQYKKDGRILRGVQKGTTAFVKSTAMEAIKLSARLATGTQVILEQAEGVLGSQFHYPITAETLQIPSASSGFAQQSEDEETGDIISKYAEQPLDVREGVQTAFQSLQRNFNSAAQTILAVPMEVYERSGSEGPVRAVIRAVPIAVLKPMIGVTEAVSKTLLGFHNSLDPDVRHENEAKYKHR